MLPNHTFGEIRTQVDAWQDAAHTLLTQQEALAQWWQAVHGDFILYTGCGSTYYLALAAASLTQARAGVPSRGVPASELLLHPQSIYPRQGRPLLVAISRSAATTETIQAARDFRERYGDHVLALSCYDDRPLNAEAALTLAARTGQEQGIAQTRSFSAMLVLAEGLAAVLAGERIEPGRFSDEDAAQVRQAEDFAAPLADPERFDRYFYLGSGPRYGLACEAMLKMKEMSQTHAEAYHPMEFRHGPKSMVNARTVVVGLLGQEGYSQEKAVLDEMRTLGATVISLSNQPDSSFRLVEQPSGPCSLVRYLPPLQWMAYHRAVKKALDPDRPHHLDMVVQL